MTKVILFLIFTINILYSQSPTENNSYFDKDCNLWVNGTNKNTELSELFNWSFVSTPITTSILELFFIDSAKGWASHNGNGALRTTDGGFNWITISFADTTFTTSYNGIYFINQNTGWCVGGAVQIRKTTNGGINWIKQTPPSVAGVLNSIYFWNENTGIAIGRKNAAFNSFIAKTTNSGMNWFEIVATTNSNNELHDQYWFNSNTGWLSGRDVLLYSTNGGANFVNLYANIPPTSNGANALLSITFVNQQTGWIGGSNIDKQNIYITTNAGSNWTFQPNPVTQYTYVQINDVKFLSSDSGWAVHGTPFSGAIMFTTNSGVNWIIENNTNTWFDCLTYYQRHKAWCGAGQGNIWYTYLQGPVAIESKSEIVNDYKLYQNYPNPFNPATSIQFNIPAVSNVVITIYDITGKKLTEIVNRRFYKGKYEITWNSEKYATGIYYYQLIAVPDNSPENKYIETRKMVLIR